jgi:hypothetical protein
MAGIGEPHARLGWKNIGGTGKENQIIERVLTEVAFNSQRVAVRAAWNQDRGQDQGMLKNALLSGGRS